MFFAATHSIEPGAYYFVIICGLRYAEAYRRELDHFIGAIASGTMPLVGGGEGVKALALADAALESFRMGRAIGIWSADSGEHSQENGARLGGTGRPLVRSVWGKSSAVGETGPFSERTVVLSASEAHYSRQRA